MSTEFSTSIESINPAIAEQYLAKNVKNRSKKNIKIGQYARDMAAGRWGLTGEGIKFDTRGHLVDGQNRMYAVIESGATIRTLVIRGVDPDLQGVMDSGSPRSGADQLSLHEFKDGKNLQAVANAHLMYHNGIIKTPFSKPGSGARLTNAEIIPYVESYPMLIEATEQAKSIRSVLPLTVGAIGLAYESFININADEAYDFFERIKNMRTNGKGDPIATLIKRVAHERSAGRRIELAFGVYLLFRAWNAFRDGETLTKFQIGSEQRGWAPIPEPR